MGTRRPRAPCGQAPTLLLSTPTATACVRPARKVNQHTVLITALVLMTVLQIADATCNLQRCWELFQSAQEVLGVREEYGTGSYNPSVEELQAKCVSLRTFQMCIRNLTRHGGCLGDLNFHSAQRGIERQMKHFNCTTQGPVFDPTKHTWPTRPDVLPACSYRGKGPHVHCGLFGDPHLRTWSSEFHTCRVQGAWPLIDNDYLTVQVTNDPVGPVGYEGRATATSRLTVVIKREDDCAAPHFVTYQAQTDSLPGTFDDGSTYFGHERSVMLTEVEAGYHVEIYLRYIDTTLVIRQIGQYFTFAARMPENLVNASVGDQPVNLQLCSHGCPHNERIDYKQFLAQKHVKLKNGVDVQKTKVAMTRSEAEAKCRMAQVVDFYFDSCVFDLVTTGDGNFTVAAYNALQDVLRLYPPAASMRRNRTSLYEIDKQYANSAATHRTTHLGSIWSRTATYCFVILLWTSWITQFATGVS